MAPVNDETRRYQRWDWSLGILTVAAIVGTAQGRRVSSAVQDVSFVALLGFVVFFVFLAWWRFARARRNGALAQWRVWVSLVGCWALSLGFGLPCIPFFCSFVRFGFGPAWDYKLLMVGFGLGALLTGTAAVKELRFPLVFGGLSIAAVGAIIPVGV